MKKECELYESFNLEKKTLKCLACSHNCIIDNNKTGICGVRKNEDGKLYLLVYGKIISMHIDPIEKKPIFNFLPDTECLSIGTVGCNLRCDFCQNHDISQISKKGEIYGKDFTPSEIVEKCIKSECPSIAYTYNEPIIFAEFIKDTAILAREAGIKNIMVTNGYWTKESFNFLKDSIDAVNIDLKSINPDYYKKYCEGELESIIDTIKRIASSGIHVEITTLVIPSLNDSANEFKSIAKFIASIDKNIPWHISRFFPNYKMTDIEATPIKTLKSAKEIGDKYLKHVYLGNV